MSKWEWRAVFFHIPFDGSEVPLSTEGALTAITLKRWRNDLNGSCAKRASLAVWHALMKLGISASVYPSAMYAIWIQRVVSAAFCNVS